jgi:hypothetical protein
MGLASAQDSPKFTSENDVTILDVRRGWVWPLRWISLSSRNVIIILDVRRGWV